MQVGDTVTFQLLKRPRSSIIPLEVSSLGDLTPAAESPPSSGSRSQQHGDTMKGQKYEQDILGGATEGQLSASVWDRNVSAGGGRATEGDEDGFLTAAVPECNRFAKFTTASDAAPLWLEAARELAQYAAEVRTCNHSTARGGLRSELPRP